MTLILAVISRFILDAPRTLRLDCEDVSGHLSSDQVLVQTEVSAISTGTELAAYAGLPPLRPTPMPYPRLLGYCSVSRVVAAGSDANLPQVGQRVFSHQSHASGGVLGKGDVLCVIPEGVTSESASLLYFCQLALSAFQSLRFERGKTAVVFGLGTIGLCAVLVAKALGLTCLAVGRRPEQAELAGEIGADAACSDITRAEICLRERLGGKSDYVISTANPWSAWRVMLGLTSFRTRIGVIGFPGRGEGPPDFNPLDSRHVYDKQLEILGCGTPPERADGRDALKTNCAWLVDEINRGSLPLGSLLGRSISPGDLKAFFEECLAGAKPLRPAIIDWRTFSA